MTETEGEGATIKEEVVKEADTGKGVKATKKFTIKEEIEVTVVTGAEAASRAIIHLTDLTNSVIQPVVGLIEALAPEVVHITIKIVLGIITSTLWRNDHGSP